MNPTVMVPFQLYEPTFVAREFQGHGKSWKVGQEFKWREMVVADDVARMLYIAGFLKHDFNRVKEESPIGDGYENLPIEALHAKVKKINDVVDKMPGLSVPSRAAMKCKLSKIKDKQIGILRTWRNRFSHDLGQKGIDLEI